MKLAEHPSAGALAGQLPACILGEHEDCPGTEEHWRDAYDQAGTRFTLRCKCGCHLLDPWPWPCADDHPVLLLMANLEAALEAAGARSP